MRTKLFIVFLSAVVVGIFWSSPNIYSADLLPGENRDEVLILKKISQSKDEWQLINNLCDYSFQNGSMSAAARLATVNRLVEISIRYTDLVLNKLAKNAQGFDQDPDIKVRRASALAWWKIKYRLLAQSSLTVQEDLLLQTLTEKALFTKDTVDPMRPPEVLDWSLGLLGDMGSVRVLPIIDKIITSNLSCPALIMKKKADEVRTTINFINPSKVSSAVFYIDDAVINDALEQSDPVMRKWGIRLMVEKMPLDLAEFRLQNLMEKADNLSNGEDMANYIREILAGTRLRLIPIEIISPNDNEHSQEEIITILGREFGNLFKEDFKLRYGENVYTKTVTAPDGIVYSKHLTIYYDNHPPVLAPITDQIASKGQAMNFTVSATDIDNSILYYYADNLPVGATFNKDTRIFSWVPAEKGNYVVTFGVMDPSGSQDKKTANIIVKSAPLAPAGLTAKVSPLTSTTIRVVLNWTGSESAENYKIEKGIQSSVSFQEVATISANVTTWSEDLVINASAMYFYQVRAGSAGCFSGYSNKVRVLTIPPAEPSNLTVSNPVSNMALLSWTDNSYFETGFLLERNGVTLRTLPPNITTTTDYNLMPNTLYIYRIKALNGNLASAASNEARLTTAAKDAPQMFRVEGIFYNRIYLKWTAGYGQPVGFRLEVSDQFNNSMTYTLPAGTNSYVYNVPYTSYRYDFKLSSIFAEGRFSGYTYASATIISGEFMPSLTVTNVTAQTITLGWAGPVSIPCPINNYILEKSTNIAGPYTSETYFTFQHGSTISGLTPNTKYYLRLKIVPADGRAVGYTVAEATTSS